MSDLKITINGQDIAFQQDESDTILRAALRVGINFPYECNSGGCGSCKFELLHGSVENLWPDAPGVSPRDHKKRRQLACQSRALSDCEIKLRLDEKALPAIRPNKVKINFVEKKALTEDMAEFVFQSSTPAQFMPGQFSLLSLPEVVGDRAYSMSNLPNEDGFWSFIIKKMPSGQGSSWIFDVLKAGDVLELDGPYGLAYLRPEIPRDIVCIGGGSGLSPIVSIVRSFASNVDIKGRKLHLFYGGRGPKDICTPAIVSELNNVNDRLMDYAAVSDAELAEKDAWDGHIGFIHELVEKELSSSLANYEYYFCGPPPMTLAVQKMLMLEHKVPLEQLHFDRFF